jgi:flagellar hook-length control protein FliK
MRFVHRVARAFESLGDRNGPVRIRLSPPELGSLRLEIKVQNGLMTARLEAETQASKHLLLDNLPLLRERLAQQEIRIERFDVNVTDHSPGGSPEFTRGQADPQGRADGQAPQAAAEAESDSEPSTELNVASELAERGRLNIVV